MKLMIIDDQIVVRKTIIKFLAEFPDLVLVGQAADGSEALEKFNLLLPDIVTLDLTLPSIDGLTCLVKFKQIKPAVKIVVITALSDKATSLLALSKGAYACLHKPISKEKLGITFQKILNGTIYVTNT